MKLQSDPFSPQSISRNTTAEAVELSERLSALLATRERERAGQHIPVPTANGELVLDAEEVEWVEAEDHYAAVHAQGGRHLIRESLASLERRLDGERFVRAHRSAIVNLDSVREVRGEGGETLLVLRGGARVPVSRRRRERVSRRLRRTGL